MASANNNAGPKRARSRAPSEKGTKGAAGKAKGGKAAPPGRSASKGASGKAASKGAPKPKARPANGKRVTSSGAGQATRKRDGGAAKASKAGKAAAETKPKTTKTKVNSKADGAASAEGDAESNKPTEVVVVALPDSYHGYVRGQPFRRLLNYYGQQKMPELRFAKEVPKGMQAVAEDMMTYVLRLAIRQSLEQKRSTVKHCDIKFAAQALSTRGQDHEDLNLSALKEMPRPTRPPQKHYVPTNPAVLAALQLVNEDKEKHRQEVEEKRAKDKEEKKKHREEVNAKKAAAKAEKAARDAANGTTGGKPVKGAKAEGKAGRSKTPKQPKQAAPMGAAALPDLPPPLTVSA